MATADDRDQVLTSRLALMADVRHANRHARKLQSDRTLQVLVADLVAARGAAGMTPQEVAERMPTTRSVVSRLESGLHTRPTLSPIEQYARAVGAVVEVRVRTKR